MRFTLAHELGHLVMHAMMPSEDMEREADRFAAEFLMPEAQIRPYFSRVSSESLAALKPVWRVSMASLLRRARDIGCIPVSTYKYFVLQMGRMGIRTREPMELDLSLEPATVISDLFCAFTKDLDYSITDPAIALDSSTGRLQRMYPVRGSGMRLIG